MARVFISHANEDLAVAVTIRDWLRDEGHYVFLARDLHEGIEPGEMWRQRLYRELKAADAVVCVVTAAFTRSPWCAVEVGIADMIGSLLLPMEVEKGAATDLLDHRQYIEYIDPQWRDRLAVALRHVEGTAWPPGRSPYPGLRPFDVSMAPVFHGRGDEVRRLTSRLRSLAERAEGGLLLVVGPSGCGKSSLVRAGLVSAMSRESGWEVVAPFLPGAEPVDALARVLAAKANRLGLRWTVAYTKQTLENPNGLTSLADELLVAGRGPARDRVLLVMDQGEELVTRTPVTGSSQLAALLRHSMAGPVRVVLTLRSEFADSLLTLPEMAGVNPVMFPLQPLDRDMIRTVIEEPARVAGLAVNRELVDRLVADTDSGEALPLLAFALSRLADGLPRDGILSAERYEELGGVHGALQQHADAALAAAVTRSGLTRDQVLAGLIRLATLDATGRATRHRLDMAGLSVPLRAAFGVFVDRRLLTTSGDGSVTVGVAHEALLTAWPPLSAAIEEKAVALRAAQSVELSAVDWRDRGRSDHYLWGAERLKATLSILRLPPTASPRRSASSEPPGPVVGLSSDGEAFLTANRNRVRTLSRRERQRRTTMSVMSVLLTVLLAVALTAGFTIWQQQDALQLRRLAVSRQLVLQADALRDSQPRISLALSMAAFDKTPELPEAQSSLLSVQARYYGRTLQPNMGAVHDVAYSHPNAQTGNRSMLATAQHDHHICLWMMPEWKKTCLGTKQPVYAVAFSPDGRLVAGAGQGGEVTLWDTQTGEKVRELTASSGPVTDIAFSPNAGILAAARSDGYVTRWQTDTFSEMPELSVGGGPVNGIAFSPNSDTLATASYAGVILWDLTSAPPTQESFDTGSILAVAFSPDPNRIRFATVNGEGSVKIWDKGSHDAVALATEHFGAVHALAFNHDGTMLATGGNDASVRLWEVGSGPGSLLPLTSLFGPSERVLGVAFSADGRTLASASADSVVGLWNVSRIPGPDIPEIWNGAVFGREGILATAGRDQQPVLWDTQDDDFLPELRVAFSEEKDQTKPPSKPFQMSFNGDGTALVTTVSDQKILQWDLSSARSTHLRLEQNRSVRATMPSARADRLVAVVALNDLHIIDTATGSTIDRSLTTHTGPVNVLAIRPDQSDQHIWVATGGYDGILGISKLNPGRPPSETAANEPGDPMNIFHDEGPGIPINAVAFTSDGKTLASGSDDGAIRLWNVEKQSLSSEPSDRLVGSRPVVAMSFSHDGTMLASVSTDGLVRLWNVASRTSMRWVATLSANAGTTAVTFRPDGKRTIFATAGQDGTPVLWDSDAGRVKERICKVAHPVLTVKEWNAYVPDEPYRQTCT